MLNKLMTGEWWLLLVRGIVILIFGFVALANVSATAIVLYLWFIIFAITDGIFSIFIAFSQRKESDQWGWGLVSGAVGILIGLIAVAWPQPTALIILYFIAIRAIAVGAIELVQTFRGRRADKNKWLTIIGGVLSIIAGLLMLFQPVAMGLVLLWVIGCWAVAMGVILIVAAFRVKGGGRPAAA